MSLSRSRRRLLFTFLLPLPALSLKAQQSNPLSQTNTAYWAPRAAIGIESAAYAEAGFSRILFSDKKLGNTVLFYTSALCHPDLDGADGKPVWGLKAGAETFAGPFGAGLDLVYLSNFSSNTVVLTPKAGIGFFGAANLFIGYNIMDKWQPLPAIGNWQLSLDVHYNKAFWRKVGIAGRRQQ